MTPPRRLTFAVSTSLLSASLVATTGCPHRTSNPKPQPIENAVNPGPQEREVEADDAVEEPAGEDAAGSPESPE